MATSVVTTGELARLVHGVLTGPDDHVLGDVAKIEEAGQGDITFVANPKYAHFAASTAASCILVGHDFSAPAAPGVALIAVANPYEAFLRALQYFYPPQEYAAGVRHSSASIDPTASVAETAHVAAGVVIGRECRIGENVVLLPGVVLYDAVAIGDGSVLHANVTCYERTVIGKNCILHAGAVVGSDGFGFVEHKDGSYEKIPQVGNVVVGDNVEIGANTCIDRATMGSTTIENGVKLDNLVHIAHNVTLGEHTAVAAQAGISGSARIGKRNRIAGQAGLVGHLTTADDVIIIAQSGVSKAITQPGRYFGSPAKDFRTALREEGALRQLPELLEEFRRLQKKVAELEKKTE
jgi:UDP-3-O-[3-hydroxymyristoyl] glucosamine N-acyltransferase